MLFGEDITPQGSPAHPPSGKPPRLAAKASPAGKPAPAGNDFVAQAKEWRKAHPGIIPGSPMSPGSVSSPVQPSIGSVSSIDASDFGLARPMSAIDAARGANIFKFASTVGDMFSTPPRRSGPTVDDPEYFQYTGDSHLTGVGLPSVQTTQLERTPAELYAEVGLTPRADDGSDEDAGTRGSAASSQGGLSFGSSMSNDAGMMPATNQIEALQNEVRAWCVCCVC